MIKNLEQYTNFNKLFQVVNTLKHSQGFYSRYYNQLINLSEDEISDIENELPDFFDEVDVIMFLEN